MNDFHGVLGVQVESLLNALRRQQEHRCKQIISEAEKESKHLLRDSRRKLRERLHQAVDDERKSRQAALLEAQHRIETRDRRKAQTCYERILRGAWPALIAELRRRWSVAEERRAWCEMLTDEARMTLANEAWEVEHPESWTSQDSRWLAQMFTGNGLPEPSFRSDSSITVGLRIRLHAACLDGTIDGLLARRPAIEAHLLAIWERQSSAGPGERHG